MHYKVRWQIWVGMALLALGGTGVTGCNAPATGLSSTQALSTTTTAKTSVSPEVETMKTDLAARLQQGGFSQAQIETIVAQADQNVTGSNTDPVAAAPAFAQGVVQALGGLNLTDAQRQLALGAGIQSSLGGIQNLIPMLSGTGGLNSLFGNLGSSVVSVLGQGGFNNNAIGTALSLLSSSAIGSVGGSGLQGNALQSVIASLAGGAIQGMPAIGGSSSPLQQIDALKFLSQGAFSNIGNLGQVSPSNLQGITQLLTSGLFSGMGQGNLSSLFAGNGAQSILQGVMAGLGQSGLSGSNLNTAINGISLGSLFGMAGIPGLSSSQQLDVLKLISQGGVSGLGNLNLNPSDLASLSQLFTGNLVGGLGGIGGSNLSQDFLAQALQSITHGAVSGAGGINGINTSDLSSIISAITQGSVGGVGNLGVSNSIIPLLTQAISQGGVQGLGGFDANTIQQLIGSVTHGATSGLGQGNMGNLINLALPFITSGAVGGLGNIGMNGNMIAPIISMLTQGATSGLFASGMNGNQIQPLLSLILQGTQSGLGNIGNLNSSQQSNAMNAAAQGINNAFGSSGGSNIFALLLSLLSGLISNH